MIPADPVVMVEALTAVATRLAAVSDTPRLDAELLLAHALGITREALLLGPGRAVPPGYAPLVARRLTGEPIAYITGRRAFWTIDLAVGPGALIPRPDSETLIEAAVAHFGEAGPRTVLDLGTGPGTLLLAALAQWPEARGVGIDRSEAALAYARRNALDLELHPRASFAIGDWAEGLADRFDLILCNPPYVELDAPLARDVTAFEPASALFAGADGLDEYRRLAPLLAPLLARGGLAALEIGADQAVPVTALFAREGTNTAIRHDLAGRARCVLIRG